MLPSPHSCLFRSLLVACLVVLVGGTAVGSYACHADAPAALLAEGQGTLDAKPESLEAALSWAADLPGESGLLLPAGYAHRVADDVVEAASALADTHPQRGPPCSS